MIGGENANMVELRVEVSPVFQQYVSEAVVRFQYLRPAASVKTDGNFVCISAVAAEAEVAKRDFGFCLYRQKIYAETLPLRARVVEGVMGR